MSEPIVFRLAEIEQRLNDLPQGETYIKPFVTVRNSESMAGGLNVLNKVSVPWKLTCDELIFCHQGTFRLMCDGVAYVLEPGDMMLVPKDNDISYEADEKCVFFYAAYPVDWKQQAGITFVPGIDPEDM